MPSRANTWSWRNTMGTPATGNKALGMRSPVSPRAREPTPPAMMVAWRSGASEAILQNAFGGMAHGGGGIEFRAPAQGAQFPGVVAEARHVAGKDAVATAKFNPGIGRAEMLHHDFRD